MRAFRRIAGVLRDGVPPALVSHRQIRSVQRKPVSHVVGGEDSGRIPCSGLHVISGRKWTMRQLALVAFYGPKPIRVAELIWACQEQIAERLGSVFEPYDIAQVHATIVSLQR